MPDIIFTSKSSKEVKIMSALSIVVLTLIIGSVILMNVSGMALITRIIIVGLIFLAFFYYFSISLKKIILSQNSIILEKNIGSEKIDIQTVSKTELLSISNLTATFSSKGFFGFNGRLMDNSKTLVNHRRKMVKIYTPTQNYVVSCDEPQRLIAEIEERKK